MHHESQRSIRIWQPMLRSEINPPVELLYHYIRLFSAQGKLVQVWNALRWLHAAHKIASTSDGSLAVLAECVEKGWLFVTHPSIKRMTKDDIVVPESSIPSSPTDFVPTLDLLYNYADQAASNGLTKTCWHLFEWLQTAYREACKRDMDPYSTGRTATALTAALSTGSIAASPQNIPFMQDVLRKRASVAFDERYVTEEVLDKLWDKLPTKVLIEILELGRRPETPRDRYGDYIPESRSSCNHHQQSSASRLLAAGGCDCPDREDAPWNNLPALEKRLFSELESDGRDSASELSEDLCDENVAELTNDDSDAGHQSDQDSAYESDASDDDDEDHDNHPMNGGGAIRAPKLPIVRIADGSASPSSSFVEHCTTTDSKDMVVIQLTGSQRQKSASTQLCILKTDLTYKRKRTRSRRSNSLTKDESDDDVNHGPKRRNF